MPSPNGRYARVCIRRKHLYVHRLVLEAFSGPCPDGMVARHLNGISADNRAENLAWGTHQANQDDRVRHGTNRPGVESHAAKLDDELVRAIRRLWSDGVPPEVLANGFGVKPTAIMRVVQGITWKHVN